MEEVRGCWNCKHCTGDWDSERCKYCKIGERNNWEPRVALTPNHPSAEEGMSISVERTPENIADLIKKRDQEIKDLKVELKKLEQYKQYDDAAMEMKAMYDSFIRAGFTEDQAFTLFNSIIGKSLAAMLPGIKR